MNDAKTLAYKVFDSFPEIKAMSSFDQSTFLCELNDLITFSSNQYDENLLIDDLYDFLSMQKEQYRNAMRMQIMSFFSFCFSNEILLCDVEPKDIENFIKEQQEKGKTLSLISLTLKRTKSFYQFMNKKTKGLFSPSVFNKVNVFKCTDNNTSSSIIPTEADLLYIIYHLPPKFAEFTAILSYKGYTYTEATNVSLDFCELMDGDKELFFSFAYLSLDEYNMDNWNPEDLDFSNFLGFDEIESPEWYKNLLSEFYKKNRNTKPFKDINPHTYVNTLAKYMKKFYDEGKISKKYTVKSLRWYAIKNMYERHHNIAEIQKLLHHTTPSTTKQFLINMGISVD